MSNVEKDIFCKIVSGELPSNKEYEDDKVIAINDLYPKAPIHVLIIPRKHIGSISELQEEDEKLIGHMFRVARAIARKKGIAENGYRLVFNTGPDAGQTVQHAHLHLLGGQELGSMV